MAPEKGDAVTPPMVSGRERLSIDFDSLTPKYLKLTRLDYELLRESAFNFVLGLVPAAAGATAVIYYEHRRMPLSRTKLALSFVGLQFAVFHIVRSVHSSRNVELFNEAKRSSPFVDFMRTLNGQPCPPLSVHRFFKSLKDEGPSSNMVLKDSIRISAEDQKKFLINSKLTRQDLQLMQKLEKECLLYYCGPCLVIFGSMAALGLKIYGSKRLTLALFLTYLSAASAFKLGHRLFKSKYDRRFAEAEYDSPYVQLMRSKLNKS